MDAAAELSEEAMEGPWALPTGWCWTRLGSVLPLTYGKALPERERNERGDFAVFGSSGRVGSHDKFVAPANSVMVGRKGSAGTVFYSKEPSWPIDTAYFTSGTAAIDIRYGYWFLWFRKLERLDQSTAIPSLSRDIYDVQFIPLAPLAEQRRIVARLDTLFAEIAEGEAALAEARKGLDTFRRALLKAAVTGELTKDWRAANSATETGHDLLVRIVQDRSGKATSSGRKRVSLGVSSLTKKQALPALPEDWAWATLGEIGEIVGGATVDQKRKPSAPITVPYLRVANVQRGYVDVSEVKSITVERVAAEKLRLISGDVLLNEGGDRDKIGRGWVWDGSIPDMIHQNHVFRVRLMDGTLNPFFVSHYANEMGRRFFIEEGKQTTNLASISLSKIGMLPVPIPPPEEVTEIIRRVSDELAAAADTAAMLDAEATDAARLRRSILKAAFEGRLVPQNTDDEPASSLLSRIAAQEGNEAKPRRTGKIAI
jgi:type I restriction enzyme, S subunit